MMVLFLQIVLAVVLFFFYHRALRGAFNRGVDCGVSIGFDIGYLRAMSDDDPTRREVVACIQRKDIPDHMKQLEFRF